MPNPTASPRIAPAFSRSTRRPCRTRVPLEARKKNRPMPNMSRARLQQPAGRELPHWKREQIERERPAEDRDRRCAAPLAIASRAVPPERDGRPLAHEPHCGPERDHRGQDHRDDRQDRPDREPDGAIVDDDDAVVADLAETAPA